MMTKSNIVMTIIIKLLLLLSLCCYYYYCRHWFCIFKICFFTGAKYV